MQLPLQYACPVGHVHMPPVHVAPAPQTAPHAPQFWALLAVSTQAPWQFVSGWPEAATPHWVVHVPAEQSHCVAPAGRGWFEQLFPHAPQLARLDETALHCPLQSV
jgi:hypothetical protein